MPGNTVALQLSKPAGFKYLSGQYVFLSVPRLGWMEWHPFTLTTAPDDDYLGLQIRAAGDWTHALHDHIKEILVARQDEAQAQDDDDDLEKGTDRSLDSDGAAASADSKSDKSSEALFPAIRIDGPYGAPTQKWQKYQTAVMVGAGIGVTPCASVLRDVLHNIQREQESSSGNADRPSLKKSQSHRARGPDCSTRKVLFYWCTRNKDEAQWFREELESIAKIDTQGILDINIHITSVGDGAPMSNFLKIAQMSSHQVHGKDVMTGLQTNFITKFGRPDWAEVLARATQESGARQQQGGGLLLWAASPGCRASEDMRIAKQVKGASSSIRFLPRKILKLILLFSPPAAPAASRSSSVLQPLQCWQINHDCTDPSHGG